MVGRVNGVKQGPAHPAERLPALTRDESVTVVVARRVRPGAEAAFEQWASEASQAAAIFPGHLGAALQRPNAADGADYVLLFRFASLADLRRWEASDERRHYLALAEPLTEGDPTVRLLTGIEGWLVPPPGATGAPPRYKMALVTGAAIFPLVVVLNALSAALLQGTPPLFRTLLTIAVVVLLMTYVVMPWLSRLLRGWLYPSRSRS